MTYKERMVAEGWTVNNESEHGISLSKPLSPEIRKGMRQASMHRVSRWSTFWDRFWDALRPEGHIVATLFGAVVFVVMAILLWPVALPGRKLPKSFSVGPPS